jgi:hypothetical protein
VDAGLAKQYQVAAANVAEAVQGKNPFAEILQQGMEKA